MIAFYNRRIARTIIFVYQNCALYAPEYIPYSNFNTYTKTPFVITPFIEKKKTIYLDVLIYLFIF